MSKQIEVGQVYLSPNGKQREVKSKEFDAYYGCIMYGVTEQETRESCLAAADAFEGTLLINEQ